MLYGPNQLIVLDTNYYNVRGRIFFVNHTSQKINFGDDFCIRESQKLIGGALFLGTVV